MCKSLEICWNFCHQLNIMEHNLLLKALKHYILKYIETVFCLFFTEKCSELSTQSIHGIFTSRVQWTQYHAYRPATNSTFGLLNCIQADILGSMLMQHHKKHQIYRQKRALMSNDFMDYRCLYSCCVIICKYLFI